MVKVAVFGGSKGCSRAMVAQGLEEGEYEFKLLIRNPDNAEYTEEEKKKMTIIQGDALDPEAVRKTVEGTDIIVFSIGSLFNFKTFKMTTPGLCADSMTVLLDVLKDLPERPKRLVVVSTTGLEGSAEVPILFKPLYKYMLHDPHVDKKNMEDLVIGNQVIEDYIIVRPSLLTDGKLTSNYRADVGISGYTISRSDVGHFMLHQCLAPTTWIKKKVVVTY